MSFGAEVAEDLIPRWQLQSRRRGNNHFRGGRRRNFRGGGGRGRIRTRQPRKHNKAKTQDLQNHYGLCRLQSLAYLGAEEWNGVGGEEVVGLCCW